MRKVGKERASSRWGTSTGSTSSSSSCSPSCPCFAPKFFNVFNFTTILNAIAMNATVAIGFTVVMICGQLDLSIGTVITFAGVAHDGAPAPPRLPGRHRGRPWPAAPSSAS